MTTYSRNGWRIVPVILFALLLASADASADDAPQLAIIQQIRGAETSKPANWEDTWASQDLNADSAEAKAVLALTKLSREQIKHELSIASQQEQYRAIKRNLDVGRHQVLKKMFAAAIVEANSRLRKQKLTEMKKLTTINCGGYGDFSRDQDITAFGEDPLREQIWFESLQFVAGQMGIHAEFGSPALGIKSGLNFPTLEVTVHCGQNDLPDAPTTADVRSFALDYRKVIERQAKMPEAYFGYGAELEVQGTRQSSPIQVSKTRLQSYSIDKDGKVGYAGVLHATADEVNATVRYTKGRIQASQNAVHMANNFLQASRHAQDPASSPSQGPLKYAGRTLNQLCMMRGMKPWAELEPPDRVELLRPLFPPDLPEPTLVKLATSMANHLDVCDLTLKNRAVPKEMGKNPVDAAVSGKVALIFLRKAAATSAGQLAREMIAPPAVRPRPAAQARGGQGQEVPPHDAGREADAGQQARQDLPGERLRCGDGEPADHDALLEGPGCAG